MHPTLSRCERGGRPGPSAAPSLPGPVCQLSALPYKFGGVPGRSCHHRASISWTCMQSLQLCMHFCFLRRGAMDRIVSSALLLFLVGLSAVAVASAATTVLLPQDYWKQVLPDTPMPAAVRDQLIPADAEEVSSASPFLFLSNQLPATEDEIRNEANADIFFLEKDLRPGATRMLHFTRRAPAAAFVPRPVADAIPFSSEYFPHILASFSIEPNSTEAEAVKKTLQACDDAAMAAHGIEARRCVTSLESMVDFAVSSLGARSGLLQALSTEGAKKRQFYTVTPSGVRRLSTGSGKIAACHAEPYPYAVFYCHAAASAGVRAYMVSLVGEDGGRATAVAVCHSNTSGWHPKHLAFLVLKVKPGTVPVCHFLPQDNVVWMPRNDRM